MIKTKKQMYALIGSFILVILLGTVTYAFFNYTRTGTANTIKTGRIAFNSSQGTAINLTNMFPIDPEENGIMDDATKVGIVTINVTGDTTYTGGLEYLVTAVNVTNTIGNKSLPISIDVSVANNSNNDPATTLGTEEEEYFENRGSVTSYYRVLAKDVIENNEQLLVGYIAPGSDGVDGNIVIKAYLDKNKIAISDTYPEGDVTHTEGEEPNEEEVVDYTNGTTSEWVAGRTVFTTTEWNALQANGVSFQVKVESNEGVWVEEIRTVNAMINLHYSTMMSQRENVKEVYFNKMGATRMQQAYDAATIKADLTHDNEGKVLAWLEENQDDNTMYNLIVASDGETYFPNDSNGMFQNFTNMTKIEFNNINTTMVTQMSSMFNSCDNLLELDLSSFDTSNVTFMNNMFNGCTNLITIDLSSFDTSLANTSSGSNLGGLLFNNCSSLQTIYVSDLWDASQQYQGMAIFSGCTSLVGKAPNTTYAFDSNDAIDKTYAVIATDDTKGYLTDISLKPTT